MPKFTSKSEKTVVYYPDEHLTREELDTKHLAALDAKTTVAWESPERVFKSRSKKYYVKVSLYGFIFILTAIAFGHFFLVGVIMAIIFVVFVLASHAPFTIEHKLTNMGIISGGRAFLWSEMDSFWFDKKGDDRLLVVQTKMYYPSRLIILLSTVSERTLLELLEKHLHYHEGPVHTRMDKWANFLQERINLE